MRRQGKRSSDNSRLVCPTYFEAPNQHLCCQGFTPENSCIYVDSGTTDGPEAG